MDRETKFRGKSPYGNWMVGSLVRTKDSDFIIPDHVRNEEEAHQEIQLVYSDTVGEYTGRKDDNGEDIYEDDIVKVGGDIHIIKWTDKTYVNNYLFHPIDTYGDPWQKYYGEWPTYKSVIIVGNIYENPELLNE